MRVKEIWGEQSRWQEALQEESMEVCTEGLLMVQFRILWPGEKEGSKGWWEEWQSWGLEGF